MLLTKGRALASGQGTPHLAQMATAFYQLSRLLSAGVVMNDALDEVAMAGGARNARYQWMNVARSVSAGRDLSESLVAVFPGIDKTIIALICAGEASGKLQQACQAVSEHLQWQHELRHRIITILVYPLFSVCLLVLVTGFLFISVVPSIQGFLVSAGGPLVWHTRLLIDTSSWLARYYLHALTAGVIIAVCISILLGVSLYTRTLLDKCLLALPVLGKLIADLSLSRYARCSAQLYASGVSMERSLELAEDTVLNRVIKADLCQVRQRMVGGISLTDAMGKMSTMPAFVHRMIGIGERSGQVAEVMNTLAEQLGSSADASIKRLEQLIAPVIMLFVGLVLLWIVVSVLGPVYNMAISTVVEAR